jgi:hypothetical protein
LHLTLITVAAAIGQDVFQLDQSSQVTAQLKISPADLFAECSLGKPQRLAWLLLLPSASRNPRIEQDQQLTSLWQQRIEALAQYFTEQCIGKLHIL